MPRDAGETEWEHLAELGRYAELKRAQEDALVILAMGEACWVSPAVDASGYGLHGEPAAVVRMAPELAAYAAERAGNSRLVKQEAASFSAGWWLYFVWAMALAAVFYLQIQDEGWVEKFASSSTGMIDGREWWRPLTSLFLHADFLHLSGNVLTAGIFAPFASRALGPLRAWGMILACGTAGNFLTAWTRYPDGYLSIGASTAVFAALGILAGLEFSNSVREPTHRSWMRMAAPLVAGFILLGWLGGGTEGGNTDVMAHAFGFGSGLLAGFVHVEVWRRC